MLNFKNRIKALVSAGFLLLIISSVNGRTLTVGAGSGFKKISEAALKAGPGDTILIRPGTYQGGEVIHGLLGTADKWIVIQAEIQGKSIYSGGSVALHLSDIEYIVIDGLLFTKQTGNGVNIDDGGSYDSPSHNIIIRNCCWEGMEATGNNDELKLSGVDDFEINNCTFLNGSKGGSLIDMVGCHRGIIRNNHFSLGGSNSIQAKGGTQDIIIKCNRFENGGERAINIGGSTGMEFFRPTVTAWEASYVKVWSNIFTGGTSAMAFVGAVNCEAVNNTIISPTKWVVRILQENRNPALLPCSRNIFRNNLIVFPGKNMISVNIGPGTNPETFTFTNNLWFNPDEPDWAGPQLPVEEPGRILNKDPRFADKEYRLSSTSPAIGKGSPVTEPENDFFNNRYASVRVVGAVEYYP
jgi:hypothetical protein